MKKWIISLAIQLIVSQLIFSQDITTVEAMNRDISENLDLEAIASIFGESKNLEDFEYKLNDPELRISNLDLNGDGYVDYLRVVEDSENNTVLITIQAVLGNDIFQDVATIDVEKDNNGKTYVQVVGDVYMYGPDYIIEPVYVYSPPVVIYFWGPNYRRWYSPYHWHYYPTHYHAWHPYSWNVYHDHVHAHVNVNHRYYYPNSRRSSTAAHIHNDNRRNDYASSNPDKSFSSRNKEVKNSRELTERRNGTQKSSGFQSKSKSNTGTISSGNTNRTGSTNTNKSFQTKSNDNRKSSSQSSKGQLNRTTTKKESSRVQSQGNKGSSKQSVTKRSKSVDSKKGDSRKPKAQGSSKGDSGDSKSKGKSKKR